jgi:acetyl-CoA C-acetyltransferase
MRPAYVTGVGVSQFGKLPDVLLQDLVSDAVLAARADAGIDEFDAVYLGNVYANSGVGARALSKLHAGGEPVVALEAACASGTVAFAEAYWAVSTGRYDTVLAVGCEHLSDQFAGGIRPNGEDPEGLTGLVLPAMYAMAASRYMDCYGVTAEQLAAVSVKNHDNGVSNPRAQYRKAVSIDEVLDSPMIADPLTLLQCCSISDGAAAVVVSAVGRPRGVRIAACRLASGDLWDNRSPHAWSFDLVHRVADSVYKDLAIGPTDIDLFEVHDAFTIGEIVTTEAIGLADLGRGGALVESGATLREGEHPVNVSGGLLSKGHPLGATGLSQITEVVLQLRGEAGAGQLDGVHRGMVETMGGGVALVDGNACAIVILETDNMT